jgi:hypothetical protein
MSEPVWRYPWDPFMDDYFAWWFDTCFSLSEI